jgi:type III secretory pathway component EscR
MYDCILTLLKIGNVTQSPVKLSLPSNTLVGILKDGWVAEIQSVHSLIKVHVESNGCLLN